MSRKRKPGRPKGSKAKKHDKDIPKLGEDTIREILAIVMIAVSLILMLATIGAAGSLGDMVYHLLRQVIGYASYALIAIMFIAGIALFIPEKSKISKASLPGILLFVLSFAGIFHLFVEKEQGWYIADSGNGGGFIGFVIQMLLAQIIGKTASLILLSAFMVIGILLATNRSIMVIIRSIKEKKAGQKADIKVNETVTADKESLKKESESSKKKEEYQVVAYDDKDWKFPPADLLEVMSTKADSGNIKQNAAVIQKTLGSFNINVEMSDVNVGPTVTQYTLKPQEGIKLNKITTLDRDLALALAAHPIRIEAPIPGKSLVGVEIPNKKAAIVRMRNILESEYFQEASSRLSVILGLDVSVEPQIADITKMPHMLIAGATGSGKSVCINTLLLSLLYQNSPKSLRMILVDPKRVELSLYNNIPHLLAPVIVEPEKTISALKWAVGEMEIRYKALQQAGKRNVEEYNLAMKDSPMPYIVIVIDELADLMAVSASEVEGLIIRLAQMSRAVGIHLILATQRPSVDVITGLIKANIPTRIAFAVASQIDSRTILDQAGAEKLLGCGDMLFYSASISKPKRIQGVFVSEKEVRLVTDFLKSEGNPEYNEEVLAQPANRMKGHIDVQGADDELFKEAADVVIKSGKASASLLQRRLRIGYARAARLIDLLEEQGIVGPADGARPREVLASDVSEYDDTGY